MNIHDFTMGILAFMVVPLALRAEWIYHKMPPLKLKRATRPLPSLSIIVPARNEAPNLHRLLPSLQAQKYPGVSEIIVVNDNSEDNTAVVADYYGARVINLTALPEGWLGKPHAVRCGVAAAAGDWLLMTDADMDHHELSAASAVCHAMENNLDGLSIFPKQVTLGPIDRAALMVGFAGLFAGLKPSSPMLNGQYILLRREAYEGCGGMTAVRQEILEDLALGVNLQKAGYNVPMMRGEDIAAVYMYDSLSEMWHSLTRLGSGSLKYSGIGAIITALFIAGAMMPMLAPFYVASRLVNRKWLGMTWLATIAGFLTWGQRFGSGLWVLLTPLGATIVQLTACWGLITRFWGRGILWKSRLVK
jgi:cellulose synthase/poly-beta-1,6-N-acetylglucosamine synthase-like glycosyltransferase